MTNQQKLITTKLIHTVIWIFFMVVLLYLAYAVIVNKMDRFVWIGIALILLEGIVLLMFNKICPLTIIARKYSASPKHNFDIYLPGWLAKNNKLIYSIFFLMVVCGVVFRMLTR